MKKKLKILIVEDEILTARCIYEDLKDLGTEPLKPVCRGEVAVETALNEKPDLILMDIRLAGKMNGIEAARKIKEKADIPVIFLSGFATDYILDKAHVVEYNEFLKKPVTINFLEPIINRFKNKREH